MLWDETNPHAFLISLGASHLPLFQTSLLGRYQLTEFRDDLTTPLLLLRKSVPGLIIIDCPRLNGDILSACEEIMASQPVPVLIFAEDGGESDVQRAMRVGVGACVIDGLQTRRIVPILTIAIERFRIDREVRAQLNEAKESLAARKVIERAKGVLMEQRGMSEADAYQLLRQTAMRQSKTIRDVAESILTVTGLLD